jgi:Zn-dependent membrane protease YugP
MFMRLMGLVEVAIILFAATVVFQLVTLPVEIDASRRALGFLKTQGSAIDQEGARSVLIAAALTYVAGALVSIINLLYLLTVTGNRRR